MFNRGFVFKDGRLYLMWPHFRVSFTSALLVVLCNVIVEVQNSLEPNVFTSVI